MTSPITTPQHAAPLPSQEVVQGPTTLAAQSDDPSVPRMEYVQCLPMWDLVTMLVEGTHALRADSSRWLPAFATEDVNEYRARRDMTFLDDHYAQCIADLVGMAFSENPSLNDDIDAALLPLLENVTGEGDAWDVFLSDALEKGLHYGHGAIWTDYPKRTGVETLKDVRDRNIRPYWMLYRAVDIPKWRKTVIGGVEVLTMVVLRERAEVPVGEFGSEGIFQYRVVEQEVIYEGEVPVRLGGISYVLKRQRKDESGKVSEWVDVESGPIVGPATIPLRPFYGGQRLGMMYSRPHSIGLAWTNLEEVQVKSDLSNVMHKCNVPTPYFVNRVRQLGQGEVKMGSGIDLAQGGSAGFLEPQGTAIDASMRRIESIREQMKRQGASVSTKDSQMTATEAELFAKQRQSRLVRAIRSLNDAANAALGDMAQYMGLDREQGGSLRLSTNVGGKRYDPQFVQLVADAYDKQAIPLDAYLHAVQHGELPREFKAEEVALRMLAQAMAQSAKDKAGAVAEDDDEPAKPKQEKDARGKAGSSGERVEGEEEAEAGLK